MTDVTLRTAEHFDLRTVVELNHRLFQEDAGQRDPYTNANWAREEGIEYFRDYLDADTSKVLVAEMDGRIVGYLVGYVRGPSSLRPIRSAALESMYVFSEVRSQGVGQQLVEAFLTWCEERGAERVSVTAYASNDGAIRFYERLGFRPKELSLERSV